MMLFPQWWMLYRMGYLSNQMGIIRRFLDRNNDWGKHLLKSKELILSEVKKREPKSVVFLGSGWLLDIPLNEILGSNIDVCLVDIAHPKQIIHKYSKHSNIKLVDMDITGGAVKWAWDNAKGERKLLDFNILLQMGEQAVSSVCSNYEFIVSINILSQLHLLIEDYLVRKNRINDIERLQLPQIIHQGHVNGLPKGRSLIISDTEAEFYDDENFLSHTSPRVFADLNELTFIAKWEWAFDNTYTYNPDYKVLYNTSAYLK
ncbi:MAG: hypothetical protein PHE03_04000 [Bacteroidales bacterium]|nr:hypothetical protein [Bacteroidales bacterium]MDD3891444.1 hypothetical protein [Bacteroidales bacterium]